MDSAADTAYGEELSDRFRFAEKREQEAKGGGAYLSAEGARMPVAARREPGVNLAGKMLALSIREGVPESEPEEREGAPVEGASTGAATSAGEEGHQHVEKDQIPPVAQLGTQPVSGGAFHGSAGDDSAAGVTSSGATAGGARGAGGSGAGGSGVGGAGGGDDPRQPGGTPLPPDKAEGDMSEEEEEEAAAEMEHDADAPLLQAAAPLSALQPLPFSLDVHRKAGGMRMFCFPSKPPQAGPVDEFPPGIQPLPAVKLINGIASCIMLGGQPDRAKYDAKYPGDASGSGAVAAAERQRNAAKEAAVAEASMTQEALNAAAVAAQERVADAKGKRAEKAAAEAGMTEEEKAAAAAEAKAAKAEAKGKAKAAAEQAAAQYLSEADLAAGVGVAAALKAKDDASTLHYAAKEAARDAAKALKQAEAAAAPVEQLVSLKAALAKAAAESRAKEKEALNALKRMKNAEQEQEHAAKVQRTSGGDGASGSGVPDSGAGASDAPSHG